MKWEVGKTYYGFNLIEEYDIKEIQSLARLFSHEKSGARLLHLENDDDNKVFSIGFRTPPSDSTGVPHIIEHCVLSGSRKYRTKEPFMDMVKGSLNTFINAMTFSDKTIYPVASRNEKDFYNLMDVYLDAVFYPRIYEIPDIFMQEGWHYELQDKNDKLTYKGVVYNEMLGSYSSPETLVEMAIKESLYPDTCYQYSSGGNPDVIPELTYDNFLDFHRKYYHPVNSYIYLYGNGNIEKQLEFINDNYLSSFDKSEVDSSIDIQRPFESTKEVESYYSISKDESDENRTYLGLSFILGKVTDPEVYLMDSILKQLLIESSAAPLKKALIDAGIGEDILHISTGGLQPSFSVVAKNASLDKKEQFKEVVINTLTKLVDEGIDKKLIEACINIIEYDLREASRFPTKGIIYHINSLDSWLYDSHPTIHLQYESNLRKLREKIDTGYFEEFIKKNIINNNHSSLVIMKPKKGLGEEKRKALEEKLANHKGILTEAEMEELIEKNIKLEKKQLSPDSPEDRDTIPNLSTADVDSKVEAIPQEVIKENNITLLFHDIFTSKISYVDFLFDVSSVEEELIPYVGILKELLAKVDTEAMDYSELSNEIYVTTGGISLDTAVYIDNRDSEIYYPKFSIKGKAIGDKVIRLLELISELTKSSKLEDKRRIKEIISQAKSRMEMSIFNNGHYVASKRTTSYFSKAAKYEELIKGLDFYWAISNISNSFDDKAEEIISKLKKVYDKVFNLNNLIVSFTGDRSDFNLVRENLSLVTDKLSKEKLESINYNFSEEKINEGILSSANVQYVSKGYNFKNLGYIYNGSMAVLATILNVDYLHNRIRARGGAYGAGISFGRSGNMTTFSYRDPNLAETIKVYDDMAGYIKNLELDTDELTTYIIGTMGNLDPALTPHRKGETATKNYISHITQEDLQRERDEVLNTCLEDIVSLSGLLEATMEKNYCCVLGNEDKVKENEELFNKLVALKR